MALTGKGTIRMRTISTLILAVLAAGGAPERTPRSAVTGHPTADVDPPARDESASSALPQDPAFDPVRVDSLADRAVCFVGSRYVVLEQGVEEVGSDLFIRPTDVPNSGDLCDTDSLGGDIVLRNQSAQYFLGLKNNLLFTDDGTGPSGRVLTIYDLTKRDTVFQLPGYDLVGWSNGITLRLWKEAGHGQSVAGMCPDTAYGPYPGLDSLVLLDLRTLRLRPTGEFRCYFRS